MTAISRARGFSPGPGAEWSECAHTSRFYRCAVRVAAPRRQRARIARKRRFSHIDVKIAKTSDVATFDVSSRREIFSPGTDSGHPRIAQTGSSRALVVCAAARSGWRVRARRKCHFASALRDVCRRVGIHARSTQSREPRFSCTARAESTLNSHTPPLPKPRLGRQRQ